MWYSGILRELLAEALWLWWLMLIPFVLVTVGAVSRFAGQRKHGRAVWWLIAAVVGLHFFGVIDVSWFFRSWLAAGIGVLGVVIYVVSGLPWAYFYEWKRYMDRVYEEKERARPGFIDSTLQRLFQAWALSKKSAWLEERRSTIPQYDGENSDRALRAAHATTQAWSEHVLQVLEPEWKKTVSRSLEVQGKIKEALDKAGYNESLSAMKNLDRITTWAMWWPFLFLYALLFDFVVQLGTRIHQAFQFVVKLYASRLQADSDRTFELVKARRRPLPELVEAFVGAPAAQDA